MYCPMKLYIQNHVDKSENKNYQLAIEVKKLKIDILDLIQKNMRKIKFLLLAHGKFATAVFLPIKVCCTIDLNP